MDINETMLKFARAESQKRKPAVRKGKPAKVATAYFYDDDAEMVACYEALKRKYPSKKVKDSFNLTDFIRAHKDEILAD